MKPFCSSRALVAVLSLAFLTSLPAVDRQGQRGHITAITTRLKPVDRLTSSKRLDLVIGLPLRNQEELTRLLRNIYDPASPNYRHYLTPEQFVERFGPTDRDYQLLIAFAGANGLAVTGRHSNRMLLDVNGAVADVERAFHVKMLVYAHPTEPRTFYAPDVEPSLDTAVPVLDISGLDNYVVPYPANLKARPAGSPAGPTPNAGSGPGGSYQGNDFRAAYLPDVSLTGSGQALGLFELDGYYTNDIAAYESRGGLPNVPVTNVLLDGFLGTPGPNNSEVALDIELALSMAPGLSELIVYEAGPQGHPNDVLNRMATDNLARQLVSSWLWGTGDDPIADQIFQQFAAQGQSFFIAAGDVDAYTGAIPFPADNPFITVVSATALSTTSGGSWASESALNSGNGQGGSGGISPTYPIPTWQQGINMTTNGGSTAYRNIPDVALVGNNVSVIYNNGQTNAFDGTSCSAPLWGALIALANQQAANYGQPAVGFINPAIYGIGQGAHYLSCFHDITTGNNTNSSSPSRFFACPGYDLCTGWGTPAGQVLVNALAAPSFLVVSPAAGLTATGLPGGPFTPSSQSFSVSNYGPTMLSWSLANTSLWLTVTPTNGTLPAGGSATPVTVSFSSAANALTSGVYSATLVFTDQNTGLTRARPFTLQISQSLVQNDGFETGSFSSWTLSGDTSENLVSASLVTPHSGNYAAVFAQGGSLAYLSQSVPTSPGQAYLLSFWLANPFGGTPNQFLINWNTNLTSTNTLLSQTNLGVFNWTNEQFVVMATGTNSVLQFGFRDDPKYLGLDDVSLIPLPTATTGLLTSSANPALPGQLVTFTMALSAVPPGQGTPTGTVQFSVDGINLIGPVSLSGGAANCTLSNLTHGLHTVAAQYAGNGTFTGTTNVLSPDQLINTPPAAGAVTIERDPTNGTKVSVATLLSNATDADGDPLAFTGYSATSANGGIVASNAGWIFYTPATGFTNTDTFTYTISDSYRAAATGTVTVDVRLDNGPSPNLTIIDLGSGSNAILGDGIPNRTYQIQFSETLPTTNWQTLGTATADGYGIFQFIDNNAVAQRFYRSVYP